MLKGISPLISPELLKVLAEMGHSDMILFADGNFPAHSYKDIPVIRMDGLGIPELLKAIIPLFPLDSFTDTPVFTMEPNADFGKKPSVWNDYQEIINEYETNIIFKSLERFEFYKKCSSVYAIVATTELEIYANIILQKGVIFP